MLFLFPTWVLFKQLHTDQLLMLFSIRKDARFYSRGLA